ncbi:MAG TPA: hypothetical protein VEJ67_01595 [Candidatus Cybelea sp.]|nr:hypothetical protein [Candidatus Cybelea sp.]
MKLLFANWRDTLPLAGLIVLAGAGAYFLFKKQPENADELERERRAYLNRIGRIVEGHILEFVDRPDAVGDAGQAPKRPALGKRPAAQRNGMKKLLFYTYSISGVTYETAQDVTGLEEQAHLKRIAVGQAASVKYDPANPSNSILLADDWSGIH